MIHEEHKLLFSPVTLKLGEIHWYILKADAEIHERKYITAEQDGFAPVGLTDFGKEVGGDEIHWWVFKKEPDLDGLRERTKSALDAAQVLKQTSSLLKSKSPKSYSDLIRVVREFAETHIQEIEALYQYVRWLHVRDILAPSILFTFRVWGASSLSDRSTRIGADLIDKEDPQLLERLTEIVFGLFRGGGFSSYTIEMIKREIEEELYGSLDYEDLMRLKPVRIPRGQLLTRTCYEVFDECTTYFEFVRNSLRNILLDIDKCAEQRNLIKSDLFWKRFIERAMAAHKAETQLWDFKQSLDMWWISDQQQKEEAKVEFSEDVASLANSTGGVLVVGVSDSPRKIVGIGNKLTEVERRLDFTRKVVSKYVQYDQEFIHFHQVSLTDDSGVEKICLIIAIAQTSAPVAVKDEKGRYSYPIRRETGIERVSRDHIQSAKLHLKGDNFDFVQDLNQFVLEEQKP